MTMKEMLRKQSLSHEYEWHRRNAGSLMAVRHIWPDVTSKIREHLAHARYYLFLLRH